MINGPTKEQIDAGLDKMIDSWFDIFYPQESQMPRGKKIGRIELRADRETMEALDELQKLYGPDVNKSEIVREAILRLLDARKRTKNKLSKP